MAVLAIGDSGFAQPPSFLPPLLALAANDAEAELTLCAKQARTLVGDVVVDTTWKVSPSKSLGAKGRAIAACVRDALKKHYKPEPGRRPGPTESYTHKIGTPTRVLPPSATLIPVWRAAIAPKATQSGRAMSRSLLKLEWRLADHYSAFLHGATAASAFS